jgi:hypothetical protein
MLCKNCSLELKNNKLLFCSDKCQQLYDKARTCKWCYTTNYQIDKSNNIHYCSDSCKSSICYCCEENIKSGDHGMCEHCKKIVNKYLINKLNSLSEKN